MSKPLIIAEKPNQAREIANGLGGQMIKKDGWFETPQFSITWAFGHLIELVDADQYDDRYKTWTLKDLPIIPSDFKYRIKKGCTKQFSAIKKLIKSPDTNKIIICTDPEREGELIARLILKMASNDKPMWRFWTSKSLTPETIQEGFNNLKKSEEYDALYESALARQHADWLVGINATRAFSTKTGGRYSVGRVQTPVLAIIVTRELEIKNFKPEDYWVLKAEFMISDGKYEGIWFNTSKDFQNKNTATHIGSEDQAKKLYEKIKNRAGAITSIQHENKTDFPPLLFSLNALQQEANKAYGFTADRTLKIAQALYETKKVLSYPRTESRHLNEEMLKDVSKILNDLNRSNTIEFNMTSCTVSEKNKKVFDSSKIKGHHALIPTGIPFNLTQDEIKLFELIVRRFIAVFYPPYKYKTTTVITSILEEQFKTIGKTVLSYGYKEIYGTKEKDQILPSLQENQTAEINNIDIVKKQTTPPLRYTDASILSAMENAQRFIKDQNLKKILKESGGIGRPSTQASMLEMLIKRVYVTRSGKNIIPTQKGIVLIKIIGEEKIANPAYTAIWEQNLEEIASGQSKSSDSFMQSIKEYTQEIIKKVKETKMDNMQKNEQEKQTKAEIGKCPEPNCGKPVYENKKSYYCSDYKEGCKFTLWKNVMEKLGKKQITAKQAETLILGSQIKLKGLKGKAGKAFDCEGKLVKHDKYGYQVELVFSN